MRGFLIFLTVVALIFVGWYMSDDMKDYGFWDIVEAEMHLLIWATCFILAFTSDNGPMEWFGDGWFREKITAILFLPVCVGICYYAARYGGDFLYRCVDALLKWEKLDLSGEYTRLPGILGEYHDELYRLGLLYSPTIWAICSKTSNRFRRWPIAIIFAALLGSLAGLMGYIIAFILAIVILVLSFFGFAATNGRKRRVFRDGKWTDEWS